MNKWLIAWVEEEKLYLKRRERQRKKWKDRLNMNLFLGWVQKSWRWKKQLINETKSSVWFKFHRGISLRGKVSIFLSPKQEGWRKLWAVIFGKSTVERRKPKSSFINCLHLHCEVVKVLISLIQLNIPARQPRHFNLCLTPTVPGIE